MFLEKLDEGFIYKIDKNDDSKLAVGSRCAVAGDGDLICSYMVQSGLGTNDFVLLTSKSTDTGKTWMEQGAVWPQLLNDYSVFCSISSASTGCLYLYGTRTLKGKPGESFWDEGRQALKQNELIWGMSRDCGRSWTAPCIIPMPIPGAAEAPGAMYINANGRLLVPYSPYNTMNPDIMVDRKQVAVLYSDDNGSTWCYTPAIRFDEENSGGAEAWITGLSDGRLLATCWHINHGEGNDYANKYSISQDSGSSWLPTKSTGIVGQSTALASLPDGRALFIYNQRKYGEVGIWLAVVRPTEKNFGIEDNQIIWKAALKTQNGSDGDSNGWTDFAFGEPSITILPDGMLIITFWCTQPMEKGIKYIKLRINSI